MTNKERVDTNMRIISCGLSGGCYGKILSLIGRSIAMTLALTPLICLSGEVSVASVAAKQRYPWNGKVDIVVTLAGASNDVDVTVCTFVATNSATQTELPITKINRRGTDSGSGRIWTRRFVWDAVADLGEVKIDDITLTVGTFFGVQLWEGGPYWAVCNVGALKPEEFGYYFWWADTVGYERKEGHWSPSDGASTEFLFTRGNCSTSDMSNSQLQIDGYIDGTGNLAVAYDAATTHLGAPWRMPTSAEFVALKNNCDKKWTSMNGVPGLLVRGRGAYAFKSVFLPAAGYTSRIVDVGVAGYYWSSSPDSGLPDFSKVLYCTSSGYFDSATSYRRYCGMTVRPVRGFVK